MDTICGEQAKYVIRGTQRELFLCPEHQKVIASVSTWLVRVDELAEGDEQVCGVLKVVDDADTSE